MSTIKEDNKNNKESKLNNDKEEEVNNSKRSQDSQCRVVNIGKVHDSNKENQNPQQNGLANLSEEQQLQMAIDMSLGRGPGESKVQMWEVESRIPEKENDPYNNTVQMINDLIRGGTPELQLQDLIESLPPQYQKQVQSRAVQNKNVQAGLSAQPNFKVRLQEYVPTRLPQEPPMPSAPPESLLNSNNSFSPIDGPATCKEDYLNFAVGFDQSNFIIGIESACQTALDIISQIPSAVDQERFRNDFSSRAFKKYKSDEEKQIIIEKFLKPMHANLLERKRKELFDEGGLVFEEVIPKEIQELNRKFEGIELSEPQDAEIFSEYRGYVGGFLKKSDCNLKDESGHVKAYMALISSSDLRNIIYNHFVNMAKEKFSVSSDEVVECLYSKDVWKKFDSLINKAKDADLDTLPADLRLVVSRGIGNKEESKQSDSKQNEYVVNDDEARYQETLLEYYSIQAQQKKYEKMVPLLEDQNNELKILNLSKDLTARYKQMLITTFKHKHGVMLDWNKLEENKQNNLLKITIRCLKHNTKEGPKIPYIAEDLIEEDEIIKIASDLDKEHKVEFEAKCKSLNDKEEIKYIESGSEKDKKSIELLRKGKELINDVIRLEKSFIEVEAGIKKHINDIADIRHKVALALALEKLDQQHKKDKLPQRKGRFLVCNYGAMDNSALCVDTPDTPPNVKNYPLKRTCSFDFVTGKPFSPESVSSSSSSDGEYAVFPLNNEFGADWGEPKSPPPIYTPPPEPGSPLTSPLSEIDISSLVLTRSNSKTDKSKNPGR